MPVKRSSYDSNSDTTSSKKPPKISLNDGASDDRELKPKGQGMEKKEQKPRVCQSSWVPVSTLRNPRSEQPGPTRRTQSFLISCRIW